MENFSITYYYTDVQMPIIKCNGLSLSIYVHQTTITFKESETAYEVIYITPLHQKFTRYYVVRNTSHIPQNWNVQLIYDMINYYSTAVLKCEVASLAKKS
jgi:hypothetical protein